MAEAQPTTRAIARPPRGWTEELLKGATEAATLAKQNPTSLTPRQAAFLAIEFYKCLLDEAGSNANVPIEESYELPHKFKLARAAMPLLGKWAETIDDVEKLRNHLFHTDFSPPHKVRLERIVSQAPEFRKSLEVEVARRMVGLSDAQLIDDSVAAMRIDLARMGGAMSYYGQGDKWDQTHVELLATIEHLKREIAERDPPSLSHLLPVVRWCSERVSEMAEQAIAAAEGDAQMDMAEDDRDAARDARATHHDERDDYEP